MMNVFVGVGLGLVRDRDGLVAGQRADHDVGAQPARISRRVSLIAIVAACRRRSRSRRSGSACHRPCAPVIPADGFFVVLQPCRLRTARARCSSPADADLVARPPNAPLQSVMTATFTTPAVTRRMRTSPGSVMPSASAASGSTSFHARTLRRLIVLPSFSSCYPWSSDASQSSRVASHVPVVDPLSLAPATPRSRLPRRPHLSRRRPRIPDQMRSQMPINPSGEAITIARNASPITVLKLPPISHEAALGNLVRHLVGDPDVGEGAEPGALDPRRGRRSRRSRGAGSSPAGRCRTGRAAPTTRRRAHRSRAAISAPMPKARVRWSVTL